MARNVFAAYFASSAVAGSVVTTGASTPAQSRATRATASSSPPTTMRSGWTTSATACPCRRNSGAHTTAGPSCPTRVCIAAVVPGGTVDFSTITPADGRTTARRSTTSVTAVRSAAPSWRVGVGTQTSTTSIVARSSTDDEKSTVPCADAVANASATPGSGIGQSPARRASTFARSLSTRTTR
ncbi:MAG: hypothetical protein PGN29_11020 [Gordonia paraffinivorans]